MVSSRQDSLAEKLEAYIVVTEHGAGIPADEERALLADRRTELTLVVVTALLATVAPPRAQGVGSTYGGYLPPDSPLLGG